MYSKNILLSISAEFDFKTDSYNTHRTPTSTVMSVSCINRLNNRINNVTLSRYAREEESKIGLRASLESSRH